MDNKTKEALKQLQAEIRQLQTTVSGRRNEAHMEPELDDIAGPRREKGEAAVQYQAHYRLPGTTQEIHKTASMSFTAQQLNHVTNEAAAAIGYALAAPQKVALLRALLGKDSEGAAELGDLTSLSTGSLYHHLRELMRADLVQQAGRSRYVLTDRGMRVLLVTLALAADA